MKIKQILVIEDDEVDYQIIRRYIKSDYHTINDDGSKTITDLIKDNNPDCILLDYHLGIKNGIDLLKEVKTGSIQIDIPIIMLTGEKNPEIIVNCMQNGATDYLIKGEFGKSEILDKIKRALETARLQAKIKEQQNRLNENEKRYRLLYDNALVAMYTFTLEGNPVSVNDIGLSMLGYSSKDEFLKKFNSSKHLANSEEYKKLKKAFKENNEIYNFQTQAITTKGYFFWIEFSLKINNESKTVDVVAININDRKKAEQELLQHTKQLQQRNEDLDAFSHTVAHDLKSPLATVMGFSDLIIQDYSNLSEKEIKEFIESIITTGSKMQGIIDSLLLLANVRIAYVKTEELNMGEIVSESLSSLKLMIEKSNAKIITPKKWLKAIGYAPFIEVVWTNYISNAIKYSGTPPHIEIGSEIINTGKTQNRMLRFWIQDNGEGISEENQKQLFKRFERLDQVKIEGHGLGLSIVRRIIERLGGKVGMKNNNGSLFYFTLPLSTTTKLKTSNLPIHDNFSVGGEPETSQPDNLPVRRSFGEGAKPSNLKILIAEDEQTSDDLLTILMQSLSKEILHTKNGKETIEICRANPDIDLILMDIRMPIMSGYGATREIRKFNKDIIIIAQTAFALEGDYKKAIDAGCNDHITKPIDISKFMNMINKFFSGKQVSG